MNSLIVLSAILAVAFSFPQQQVQFQQDQNQNNLGAAPAAQALVVPSNGNLLAYVLPAGYETLVPNLNRNFNCDQRTYGFYADVDNECKIFHVCNPVLSEVGDVVAVDQFSFLCGNGTIFDQGTLTCNYPDEATPCQDAPSLYDSINGLFFRDVPKTAADQSDNIQSGKSLDSFQQIQFNQQFLPNP